MKPEPKRVAQLNFNGIDRNLEKLVKTDAKRFNLSLVGIGEVIIRHFYLMKGDERALLFDRCKRKRMGRKIL